MAIANEMHCHISGCMSIGSGNPCCVHPLLQDAVAAVAELPGLEAVLVNCCCPQARGGLPRLPARQLAGSCAVHGSPAWSPQSATTRVLSCDGLRWHSGPSVVWCRVQAAAAALPVLAAAAPPHVRVGCYANGFRTTTSGK